MSPGGRIAGHDVLNWLGQPKRPSVYSRGPFQIDDKPQGSEGAKVSRNVKANKPTAIGNECKARSGGKITYT
jgi:hypothetical protein